MRIRRKDNYLRKLNTSEAINIKGGEFKSENAVSNDAVTGSPIRGRLTNFKQPEEASSLV
ncbi:MAG: hypothetical protein A2X09_03700 [Bacteroidetes bacterium GWF2_43_11]|nr:MAG: hypothetical protein A2X09_03700 [Bacteroidetes bacterium GWF2_43_11]